MLLSLHEVTKTYGRRTVLEIDRLELAPGARMMILGSNGSGKSTLLRLLAGIAEASSGTIERSPEVRQARIGFVPQQGGVNPEETVRECLRSTAMLYDRAVDIGGVTGRCIEAFSLERFMNQRIGPLSGGYQKLVSLTAVLGVEPDLLFLDEATSGLDRQHVEALGGILGQMAPGLKALVLTDHAKTDLYPLTEVITLAGGRMT